MLAEDRTIWDVVEDDVPGLCTALLEALGALGLAYTLDTALQLFDQFRRAWTRTYVVNPSSGVVGDQAGQDAGERWLGRGADLVSFGRAYLANPHLVERCRNGQPLRVAEPATYYGGGDAGYIDHPSY